ncbi:MAG TPA: preprotein translocase subunit YajC [Dehalococcoidia bacterium]|nr:preprotein translocase subunit YajC [Dehalococcoidia bacterium]
MNAAELSFVVVIGIIFAFYLIVLRPQQQEQKRQHKDIQNLQVGDEVLTTGGLLGTVREVYIPETGPVQIIIDFGNGILIHAVASAIAQRVAAGQTVHSQETSVKENQG